MDPEESSVKILVVAMGNSLHTYRWIRDAKRYGQNLTFSLYSSEMIPQRSFDIRSRLDIRVWNHEHRLLRSIVDVVTHPFQYLKIAFLSGYTGLRKELARRILGGRRKDLARVIRRERPDVVHSLHTQSSGYLVLEVRSKWKEDFPIWVNSFWGSDLFYSGKFPEHGPRIRSLLSKVDFVISEGARDQELARQLGFRGELLPTIPACGGMEIGALEALRASGSFQAPSRRREITIKGYQNLVGRLFVALRALTRTRDLLAGYTINVYSAESLIERVNVEAFGIDNGLEVRVFNDRPVEEILMLHSRSRISIGLSVSDGLPASLVEAMAAGAFPIQSNTSMADEWITDGRTGLLVPPEDPEVVEAAIRTALTDDLLVDQASAENWEVIRTRANADLIGQKIAGLYENIAQAQRKR